MTINLDTKFQKPKLYQNQNQKQDKASFKGGVGTLKSYDKMFKASQVDPIWTFTAVDFFAMVLPRTIVDTTRNVQAGIETFIREFSSNVITCALPGITAFGVAKTIGQGLKGNKIIQANSDTVNHLNKNWQTALGDKNFAAIKNPKEKAAVVGNYVDNALKGVTGLVGSKWEQLQNYGTIKNDLVGEIQNSVIDKSIKQKNLAGIKNKLVNQLKAGESLKLGEIPTTAENIVRDIHDLGSHVFTKYGKKELPSALDKIKKTNIKKAWLGLAIVCGINSFCQSYNKYLTKKRTGSDAFVGLPDFGKDKAAKGKPDNKKSKSFMLSKLAATAGIIGIGLSTIAGSVNPKKIGQLLNLKNGKLTKAIEFNGMWPGAKQLAVIYTTTIAGRLLASRDKNELRETVTRDYTGFLNWLVLGGFVSKLAGSALSKGKNGIMNGAKTESKNPLKKVWNTISNQSLKSHDEILAMKLPDTEQRKALTKLNVALGTGFVYSTLALGFLMPYINKKITERVVKKEKDKALANNNQEKQATPQNTQQKHNVELKNSLVYNQSVPKLDKSIQNTFSKFRQQAVN